MGCVTSITNPCKDSVPRRRSTSLTLPPSPASSASWSPSQEISWKFNEAAYADFGDDDDITVGPTAASADGNEPEPEVHVIAGSLALSTRIEYQALPCGQVQDVFGIVTLQAASTPPAGSAKKPRAEQRQPRDIICVLDVSGSMEGAKIRQVQDAVRFIIRESQPNDRLSIVTFNQQAARPLRLRRMDQHGKDEATQTVLRLSAGGGTRIASGLEMAMEIAERRRQRNPVSAIFLLTDGQDGSSGHSFASLIQRAQRVGCSLYPFGFGSDHDSQLLSNIAELAQSTFTFVEDDQLGSAFAGAIGGLSSIAAQRVELVLDSKVALKAVHTPFTISRSGERITVQIPDMFAGERRDFLVELSVPVATSGEETLLLEAFANYWDMAAEASVQTTQIQMLAQRVDELQPEQEPDEEVTVQRQRVEVMQTLEAAAAQGDRGGFEEAKTMLHDHEMRLRSSKPRLSPITESLAIELADAHGRMQNRSAWENGGHAQLRDAVQMHGRQRTTNTRRRSCEMYATKSQVACMSKV